MKLFGTSGIRGKFKEKITANLSLNVGKALATYLKGKGKVIVGYDPRTSSQIIENALSAGLMEGGCHIIKIGMVPTPLVGYATSKLKANAGVMITASHNPPEYNGIKLWNPNGMAYSPEQEQEIEKIIKEGNYHTVNWEKLGNEEYHPNIIETYMENILKHVNIKPGLKVVVDCGCGAASYITPILLRKAGCKILTLNSQPDGFFPGRNPEPIPENLKDLMNVVKTSGADLGIAHDGDADRTICIDENGDFIFGDKTFALVEKKMLKENSGGLIVTTVATTSAIYDIAKENNGEVITTAVGDLLVARTLKEKKGLFGGEENGGLIFPDFVYGRDGALSAAKILEIMAEEGKPISKLVAELPRYYSEKMKIKCPDELKPKVMAIVQEKVEKNPEVKRIDTTDGVKVFKEAGWVIIRPSGTEPIFRCFAEAKTQKNATKMAKWGISIVEESINEVKDYNFKQGPLL